MRIISILSKLILWPICRIYARHIIGDGQADAIYRLLCSIQFVKVHRFWPNFVYPRRFTEKLWRRMLYDRNPKLTIISDKLGVREYVRNKVGNEYLIPLLWYGENVEGIPYDELPSKYVIKTNHGCGYNIFINNATTLDRVMVKRQINKWLGENFCQDKYIGSEWGYKNISPAIIVEPFIEENGKAPVDYKFYCFYGRVEFLTLHFDRHIEHKTRSFNRKFEPHEFRYDFEPWTGEYQRPSNYDDMVKVAESLAEEFDFIRVDLYCMKNKIYFSELTPYPGGVATKFLPVRQDYIIGDIWKNRKMITLV
jgi:hypothetical protein